MMEQITDLPKGLWGFMVSGTVSSAEADPVLNAFDATAMTQYDVALLMEFVGEVDLSQISEEERAYNRLMARGRVRRFAFVALPQFLSMYQGFTAAMGCECQMFQPGQRHDAIEWLKQADVVVGTGEPSQI
ncbi:MAG: STAS/SEC14 domain-containing protein [Pseudomonadota bacterium]